MEKFQLPEIENRPKDKICVKCGRKFYYTIQVCPACNKKLRRIK